MRIDFNKKNRFLNEINLEQKMRRSAVVDVFMILNYGILKFHTFFIYITSITT